VQAVVERRRIRLDDFREWLIQTAWIPVRNRGGPGQSTWEGAASRNTDALGLRGRAGAVV